MRKEQECIGIKIAELENRKQALEIQIVEQTEKVKQYQEELQQAQERVNAREKRLDTLLKEEAETEQKKNEPQPVEDSQAPFEQEFEETLNRVMSNDHVHEPNENPENDLLLTENPSAVNATVEKETCQDLDKDEKPQEARQDSREAGGKDGMAGRQLQLEDLPAVIWTIREHAAPAFSRPLPTPTQLCIPDFFVQDSGEASATVTEDVAGNLPKPSEVADTGEEDLSPTGAAKEDTGAGGSTQD